MTEQTLVLSAGFEPVAKIAWRRAVALILKGSAHVIEEYDRDVGLITMSFRVPAVIQLVRSFKRHRAVKFSRANIYVRDNYICAYCHEKKRTTQLTYDHVLPRCQGGKTTWTNVTTCCSVCNLKKGGRTPEQARMPLRTQPTQPKWLPNQFVLTFGPASSIPDIWRSYCYWNVELENENP